MRSGFQNGSQAGTTSAEYKSAKPATGKKWKSIFTYCILGGFAYTSITLFL